MAVCHGDPGHCQEQIADNHDSTKVVWASSRSIRSILNKSLSLNTPASVSNSDLIKKCPLSRSSM